MATLCRRTFGQEYHPTGRPHSVIAPVLGTPPIIAYVPAPLHQDAARSPRRVSRRSPTSGRHRRPSLRSA